MSSLTAKKWKYLSLGLLAILAVGFSVPEVSGHVTSSISHVVGHIFDLTTAIKEKTDNLPTDPASQSATGTTRSVKIDRIENGVEDGGFIVQEIIPQSFVKTFSGHATLLVFSFKPADIELQCSIGQQRITLVSGTSDDLNDIQVSENFTCAELRILAQDVSDGDDNVISFMGLVQYVETEDVSEAPVPIISAPA